MTPEDRAKSVLHFLDEYLVSHWASVQWEGSRDEITAKFWTEKMKKDREFLGMALVALVTDAQSGIPDTKGRVRQDGPSCHPEAFWTTRDIGHAGTSQAVCSICGGLGRG